MDGKGKTTKCIRMLLKLTLPPCTVTPTNRHETRHGQHIIELGNRTNKRANSTTERIDGRSVGRTAGQRGGRLFGHDQAVHGSLDLAHRLVDAAALRRARAGAPAADHARAQRGMPHAERGAEHALARVADAGRAQLGVHAGLEDGGVRRGRAVVHVAEGGADERVEGRVRGQRGEGGRRLAAIELGDGDINVLRQGGVEVGGAAAGDGA